MAERKPARRSDDRFRDEIERKTKRKLRARHRPGRGIWYGLGLMGLVGWTVAIPVLIGVAIGVWLDRSMGTGVAWTLSLVVLGFAVGCLNAWYWVRRESREPEERSNEENDEREESE